MKITPLQPPPRCMSVSGGACRAWRRLSSERTRHRQLSPRRVSRPETCLILLFTLITFTFNFAQLLIHPLEHASMAVKRRRGATRTKTKLLYGFHRHSGHDFCSSASCHSCPRAPPPVSSSRLQFRGPGKVPGRRAFGVHEPQSLGGDTRYVRYIRKIATSIHA